MRRAARTGDDDLEAFFARALGEFIEPIRRAMRRYDQRLEGNPEFRQDLGGMLHGFPVGGAAHDDGDCFFAHRRAKLLQFPQKSKQLGRRQCGRTAARSWPRFAR